ncbi:dTDP-4-dehydrorhamnose reductase [Bacillus mesophilum]|uniref:dTDP-4-dehydrorhamnose reductase n=1 Tax=Bacillus mesophilum TaxID=1071718 RepID=A0A7V7V1B4_9BACI|nr:dTDP-4-dehydrorhamnose reductase [Bacillus mesophilum]KAB2335582.1 dTDP-4-dehydrorhamnose reductase [Bacillus mesophilum]
MRIVVTGAGGQVGVELTLLLNQNSQYQVFPLTKKEFDITNEEIVCKKIAEINPDWVVHCAAYTNVDAAEDVGKELCWNVNKNGAAIIGKAAALSNSKLIYISTDYVFDGRKHTAYQETDETNPLNEYGGAKLAGEKEIFRTCLDSYIVRTSWVFGKYGKNFVYTMLKLAETSKELKIVDDQYGRPTYAKDLAAFINYIIMNNPPTGIYHFSNENTATWYEFARGILKDHNVKVLPIRSNDYKQKALRPKYNVLSLEKAKSHFQIPTWETALDHFMKNLK